MMPTVVPAFHVIFLHVSDCNLSAGSSPAGGEALQRSLGV